MKVVLGSTAGSGTAPVHSPDVTLSGITPPNAALPPAAPTNLSSLALDLTKAPSPGLATPCSLLDSSVACSYVLRSAGSYTPSPLYRGKEGAVEVRGSTPDTPSVVRFVSVEKGRLGRPRASEECPGRIVAVPSRGERPACRLRAGGARMGTPSSWGWTGGGSSRSRSRPRRRGGRRLRGKGGEARGLRGRDGGGWRGGMVLVGGEGRRELGATAVRGGGQPAYLFAADTNVSTSDPHPNGRRARWIISRRKLYHTNISA